MYLENERRKSDLPSLKKLMYEVGATSNDC